MNIHLKNYWIRFVVKANASRLLIYFIWMDANAFGRGSRDGWNEMGKSSSFSVMKLICDSPRWLLPVIVSTCAECVHSAIFAILMNVNFLLLFRTMQSSPIISMAFFFVNFEWRKKNRFADLFNCLHWRIQWWISIASKRATVDLVTVAECWLSLLLLQLSSLLSSPRASCMLRHIRQWNGR